MRDYCCSCREILAMMTRVIKLIKSSFITIFFIAFVVQPVCADDVIVFNIPRQNAGEALPAFGQQADISVVYSFDEVKNHQTSRLRGEFTISEAIDVLLENSGLNARFNGSRHLIITIINDQARQPMISKTAKKSFLAALASAVFSIGGGSNVMAQNSVDGASAAGLVDVLEEVTVTGSRIRRDGMVTPTPVTSVNADELNAMSPGAMIEGLSQLPQFFGNEGLNATPPGGSWFTRGGFGQLNLRGLGTNRTLTLLNGRRVISPTAFGGVDINVFPEAMISNIETVTGGASAAYGTDAVAGVANFMLNTNFTGVEAHFQTGETSVGDGGNNEFSLAFGADIGDKAHLQFSYEKAEQDAIQSYDGRSWYQGWGTVTDTNGIRQVVPNVVSKNGSYNGVIFAPGTPLQGMELSADGQSISPYQLSSVTTAGPVGIPPSNQSITGGGSGDDFNSQVANLMPEYERESLFIYGDYEVNDDLKIYGQYINGKNETWRYNAPGGSFHGTPTALTIFDDNAFLPASVRQTMTDNGIGSFTFRNMGGLADLQPDSWLATESEMESFTVGFEYQVSNGGFFDSWSINGYYQTGSNERKGIQSGLRVDRIFAAIDAVDDGIGNIVCRTTTVDPAAFPGCEPINLFGQGNASTAAIDYVMGFEPGEQITTPLYFADTSFALGRSTSFVTGSAKVNNADMDQDVWEISANGEISEGWGAGPIDLAIGYSYRKEEILQVVHDVTNQASNHDSDPSVAFHPVSCNDASIGLRGVNGADCGNTVGVQYSKVSNILGEIEVDEFFIETLVPLLSDVLGVEHLTLNLAARWADYSGSGDITAWKTGFDWQIVPDLRFRATVSQDVRAANLSERFDRTGGASTIVDPQLGNSSYSITFFSGGNPEIEPEEADTVTAGFVYEPAFVDGFSVSLDWYKVEIDGAIGTLTTQGVINACEAGDTAACGRITRDSGTNQILLVGDQFINIDREVASGIDLEIAYRTDVEWLGGEPEDFGIRVFLSHLGERSQTNAGANEIDRAGQTGIESSTGRAYALPDNKLTAQLTYHWGNLSTFLQGRYIDAGTSENNAPSNFTLSDNSVDSVFYTDLNISYEYQFNNGMGLEAFGNITNLFDQDPPVTPYYNVFLGRADQDNSLLFDVLGRRYTAGLRFRF